MRKSLFALVLIAMLALPSAAFAQQPKAQSVWVELWPEYDQPAMLAIYRVSLDPAGAFPVRFEARIPSSAEIHTVAVGSAPETVSDQNVSYEAKKDGEWMVVFIQAEGPAIQIEYYAPIEKKGAARAYQFRWLSDYNVDKLNVVLQQPFDASNFKFSLPLKDEGVKEDSLRYFSGEVGAVKAGEAFSFALSYEKASDALSVSQINLPVQAPAPLESASGRASLTNALPYVVGGIGALLIIGGVLYMQWERKPGARKSRRRAAKSAEGDGEEIYCSQCGVRARKGDRFCRSCGSRLRRAEE